VIAIFFLEAALLCSYVVSNSIRLPITNPGTFREIWISKSEWEEEGERVVIRKSL